MAKSDNKKALRKQVEKKLTESFSDMKDSIGDKKFSKKVKKAGKIMAAGIVPGTKKPDIKKPKTKVPKK